ncbi:MAG: hypothetical protein HY921_05140 [Elusimicrobia bacterium]|nr:hypothetical protein [Elusimicrobiota bacterium]
MPRLRTSLGAILICLCASRSPSLAGGTRLGDLSPAERLQFVSHVSQMVAGSNLTHPAALVSLVKPVIIEPGAAPMQVAAARAILGTTADPEALAPLMSAVRDSAFTWHQALSRDAARGLERLGRHYRRRESARAELLRAADNAGILIPRSDSAVFDGLKFDRTGADLSEAPQPFLRAPSLSVDPAVRFSDPWWKGDTTRNWSKITFLGFTRHFLTDPPVTAAVAAQMGLYPGGAWSLKFRVLGKSPVPDIIATRSRWRPWPDRDGS